MQIASMVSFREKGFDVNFWSYRDYDIPDGVTRRNPRSLLAEDALNDYKFSPAVKGKRGGVTAAKYTAMSDIIRFKILASEEGWWSDCDVLCLRPAEDFDSLYSSKDNVCLGFFWESDINTAVMAFPNKKVASMISYENEKILHSQRHLNFGDLNMSVIGGVIDRGGFAHEILPISFFYPSAYALEKMWSERAEDVSMLSELSRDSYTIHWHNSFKHDYDQYNCAHVPGFIGQLISHLPQEELAAYPCW